MKKRVLLSCLVLSLSTAAFLSAQGGFPGDNLFELKPVETNGLPVNLFLYDRPLPVRPVGGAFSGMEYSKTGQTKFLPDLLRWQKEYAVNNNLRNILRNPTLGNGTIMGYAVDHKSMANLELYQSYMWMNRKMSGYDQWYGIGAQPKNIRYVDVIGLTLTGLDYMINYVNDPDYFQKQEYLFEK